MYLHFKDHLHLLENPDRAAIMDAMVFNETNQVSNILLENSDHGLLLEDGFLTPTLMTLASQGSRSMFSVWKEYGYGFNTVLISPDDGRPRLTLGQWAALALDEERLIDLQEMRLGFNPWLPVSLPSSRHNLFVSPAILALCEGQGTVVDFWMKKLPLELKKEQEGQELKNINLIGPVHRSVSDLLHSLKGMEMLSKEKSLGPEMSDRLTQILEIIQPILWPDTPDKSCLKSFIERGVFYNIQDKVLQRLMDFFLKKNPNIVLDDDFDAESNHVTWQVFFEKGLSINQKNVGNLLHSMLDSPTDNWDKTWNAMVKRGSIENPLLLASLPGWLKTSSSTPCSSSVLKKTLNHWSTLDKKSPEAKSYKESTTFFQNLPLALTLRSIPRI